MIERSDLRPEAVPADVLHSAEPVLMRRLVAQWPLVQAARRSDSDFCAYLHRFGGRSRVGLWRGGPEIGGRFFYNEDLSGFNFRREIGSFGGLLDELLAGSADALYLGSTELDGTFPGLRAENAFPAMAAFDPLVNLWLGNRTRVATHFDVADNIACVVAGRRRFTLFPPEQVANLYVGPLDLTPAGQPVSLVDPSALPSVAEPYRNLEATRRAAYDAPWSQAFLRGLELADYRALPTHQPGWLAARLQLTRDQEDDCLALLQQASQISLDAAGRFAPTHVTTVDTRRDPAAARSRIVWTPCACR